MITKQKVIDKLTELESAAVESGLQPGLVSDLLSPLHGLIDSYYRLDIAPAVSACIVALSHSEIRTGIVYEDGRQSGSVTGPAGYNDITELFQVGDSILITEPDTFINSIIEVKPLEGGAVYYASEMVSAWEAEYTTETTIGVDGESIPIISHLNEVAAYANGVGVVDGIKTILEPSRIVSAPSLSEIAGKIYLDRKYKELIDAWGLTVFVPAAVRRISDG